MSVNYPDFSDSEPIYIQIAEWLENKIVTGQLKEDEQIPSTTELSVNLKINPATMLMYGKEASNRKQEIDRQHYTIPNQRPKDKHCGKI